MAKCGKSGACPCMCNVKQKRKPTVRRPPPARVYKGTTATAPGVDITSLVRLVSDLTAKKVEQPIIPPTATIGIPEAAKNIKPMVSSTSGTLSSSVGTETTPEIRTYGTQTYGMGVSPREKILQQGAIERATPRISEIAIQAATPAISQKALESKVFTQIKKSGNIQIPLPELEQRLAAGQILIPGGGRPTNEERLQRVAASLVDAAAEAAAGQPQP